MKIELELDDFLSMRFLSENEREDDHRVEEKKDKHRRRANLLCGSMC